MKNVSTVRFLFFTSLIIPVICCAQKAESIKTVKNIERYGSVIGLKPEFEERYIILHKHTFPGVLDRIRKSNIRNYSIFLKDGILFSHFEYIGLDFETDMAQMGDEVTKEWWKLTDPMQEPLESRQEGEWWTSLELLYEMNNSKVPYEKAQRSAFVANLNSDQKQNFRERLDQIDQALIKLYLKYNVQNLTFYYHDNRVYFYSEYVGTDYRSDMNQLFQHEVMRKLDSDLNAFLQSGADSKKTQTWQRMKEVFHTD
jgi:L-rhamnose mutarotase